MEPGAVSRIVVLKVAQMDRAGGLPHGMTYMEYEGWDGLSSTRGDMVHHIGVGDVFVAAGSIPQGVMHRLSWTVTTGRSGCPRLPRRA